MKNRGSGPRPPAGALRAARDAGHADGSYNIGYVFTPYDRFTGRLRSGGWRPMDEVWVTSDFQRESARGLGVKREAFVMPPGVDPDYFHPGITGYRLPGRFTFLATVDWGRSAASETLLGRSPTSSTPREKVVLVMKVTSPSPGGEVEEAVEAMALPPDRAPVVFVLDHDVPHYQRACLLRSADCLVLPLEQRVLEPLAAEALACGVPVIASERGADPELFDSVSAFTVEGAPCRLREARARLRTTKVAAPPRCRGTPGPSRGALSKPPGGSARPAAGTGWPP